MPCERHLKYLAYVEEECVALCLELSKVIVLHDL